MTARLKKLLVACHPDRHGGDHSRMEEFFAARNQSLAGRTKEKKHCRVCGVPVSGNSNACGLHWRQRRKIE